MDRNIAFLKELQEELLSQPHDHQASPRFWTIGDYKMILVPDGYGDEVMVVDEDGDRKEIGVLDYAKEIIEEGNYDDRSDFEDFKYYVEVEDIHEVMHWIEENTKRISFMDFKKEFFVRENTMFLTKEEAKQHLEANSHHYSSEAHTYAMTAWRAPKVERLLQILETMDWDAFEKG